MKFGCGLACYPQWIVPLVRSEKRVGFAAVAQTMVGVEFEEDLQRCKVLLLFI